MDTSEITTINVSELTFDFKNPRLVEFDLTPKTTESEIIAVLWEAMDVKEIALSIAASGFFRHEPLIVARENEQNIVIEGNRRLAAVKILLNPTVVDDLNASLPVITQSAKADLKTLPCLISTRKEAWQYIGFKHVNGPAKWGSYAKSQYVADVHRDFGVPLADIAQQIGDTHRTVQRLFRGLMVIEQAEKMQVFDRENRWYRHFSFSHLYTGLDYPGISSYIGLRPANDEDPEPVPSEKKDELRQLCLWLYGNRREQIRPVIQSQNPHLRQLDATLSDRGATADLRRNGNLAYAFESSRPASNRFEESLLAAREHLQKARGMLSEGYDGSEELLRTAGTVANLADDLYREMERKRNPVRESRMAEDA